MKEKKFHRGKYKLQNRTELNRTKVKTKGEKEADIKELSVDIKLRNSIGQKKVSFNMEAAPLAFVCPDIDNWFLHPGVSLGRPSDESRRGIPGYPALASTTDMNCGFRCTTVACWVIRLGPKMGHIGRKWDIFRSDFSTFWRATKCTEIWSEKVPDLSHFGPIWPILGTNLVAQLWLQQFRDVLFGIKMGQIGTEGKSGLFKVIFLLILSLCANLTWLTLEKIWHICNQILLCYTGMPNWMNMWPNLGLR